MGNAEFMGMELIKAVEEGGKISLKGTARPLNSGSDADLFAIFCNYDGVSIAFVDGSDVERGKRIKSAGLIASRNCDIKVDTIVDKSRIVGGTAWMKLKTWLNLCLTSLCVGSAFDSHRIVKEWAERRIITGRPLKDITVDAAVLANVSGEVVEAKMVAQILAKMMLEKRSEEELHTLSTIAALKCSSSAFRAADRAMELMGSQGYAWEGLLEKQWRDAKSIASLINEHHSLLEIAEKFYGSKVW